MGARGSSFNNTTLTIGSRQVRRVNGQDTEYFVGPLQSVGIEQYKQATDWKTVNRYKNVEYTNIEVVDPNSNRIGSTKYYGVYHIKGTDIYIEEGRADNGNGRQIYTRIDSDGLRETYTQLGGAIDRDSSRLYRPRRRR